MAPESQTRRSARSAEEFARTESTWTTLSWFRLEARVLRDYPDLNDAAVRFAPKSALRDYLGARPTITRSIINPVLAVAQLVSFVLPPIAAVLAVRTVLDDVEDFDLGRIGLFMAIAAAISFSGIMQTRNRPEAGHPRTTRKVGAIHLVSSLVAGGIGIWVAVTSPIGELWGFIGIAMDLAVGVYLVAVSRIPANENADVLNRAAIGLARTTAELTAQQKDAIVEEVRRAVAILRERDLIDAAAAAKAHDAPAGYLALRMIARDAEPSATG